MGFKTFVAPHNRYGVMFTFLKTPNCIKCQSILCFNFVGVMEKASEWSSWCRGSIREGNGVWYLVEVFLRQSIHILFVCEIVRKHYIASEMCSAKEFSNNGAVNLYYVGGLSPSIRPRYYPSLLAIETLPFWYNCVVYFLSKLDRLTN